MGYIDSNGKIIMNPTHIAEDLAQIVIEADENGKWGLINKKGEFIVNPQFDEINDFREGLAAVRIGDYKNGNFKWGFC
ncbi:MAG: WG repeat-containing protein [Sphingobacterium sp.]|nr:WG repeat-containing protein [Sphingobacterium sp.]